MILTPETERSRWNAALLSLPAPHVLQSWEWGAVKSQTGWTAKRLLWRESSESPSRAAASMLLRSISRLPWGVAYVPKGPLLDWTNPALVQQVVSDIEAQARKSRAIFVKIDPDVREDDTTGRLVLHALERRGWRFSADQIQFKSSRPRPVR